MNDLPLTQVQSTRPAGRLVAVVSLGALLFGVVGCAPDAMQAAPDSTQQNSAGADDNATNNATNGSADDSTNDAADDSAGNTDGVDQPATEAGDVVAIPPHSSAADALDRARTLFDGQPSKIGLDHRQDGTLEYDIELVSNTEKYEVELDANTLEVLSEERESLDSDDDDLLEVFDLSKLVDLSVAAKTARQAQDGVIREWQLEGDSDGPTVYEFDIVPAGATDDIEVRVNALDGSLLPTD